MLPDHLRRVDDADLWSGFRLELEVRGLRVTNVHLGAPFLLGPTPHSPGLSSLNPFERQRRIEWLHREVEKGFEGPVTAWAAQDADGVRLGRLLHGAQDLRDVLED